MIIEKEEKLDEQKEELKTDEKEEQLPIENQDKVDAKREENVVIQKEEQVIIESQEKLAAEKEEQVVLENEGPKQNTEEEKENGQKLKEINEVIEDAKEVLDAVKEENLIMKPNQEESQDEITEEPKLEPSKNEEKVNNQAEIQDNLVIKTPENEPNCKPYSSQILGDKIEEEKQSNSSHKPLPKARKLPEKWDNIDLGSKNGKKTEEKVLENVEESS